MDLLVFFLPGIGLYLYLYKSEHTKMMQKINIRFPCVVSESIGRSTMKLTRSNSKGDNLRSSSNCSHMTLSMALMWGRGQSSIGSLKYYTLYSLACVCECVLGRPLMIDWRKKSWNLGRVSSVSTFVSVRKQATGHSFWPWNLIFGLSDPWENIYT